jgi:type IV pilus assembly protein PilZ
MGEPKDNDDDSLPTPSERRRSARMPVELWVQDVTDGGVVYRRAGNLSKGGLYLDQTIPLPVGSRIKLRFSLPDDPVTGIVIGQIVSINASAKLGMGVKFLTIDQDFQLRIEAFIERAMTPPLGVPSAG